MVAWLPTVAKALGAFFTTLAAQLVVALPDGITANEWLVIVPLALAAAFAVWAVPNKTTV
jgi:hypothetical protein